MRTGNSAEQGIVTEALRTDTISTRCTLRGKSGESSRGKNKSWVSVCWQGVAERGASQQTQRRGWRRKNTGLLRSRRVGGRGSFTRGRPDLIPRRPCQDQQPKGLCSSTVEGCVVRTWLWPPVLFFEHHSSSSAPLPIVLPNVCDATRYSFHTSCNFVHNVKNPHIATQAK